MATPLDLLRLSVVRTRRLMYLRVLRLVWVSIVVTVALLILLASLLSYSRSRLLWVSGFLICLICRSLGLAILSVRATMP